MKKRYKIILLLIVLLGGVAFCIIRWNDLFICKPEPYYYVSEEPDQIVLLLDSNALNDRTITWRSGKTLKESYIVLCKDTICDTLPATGSIVQSKGGEAAYYKVDLDSLKEGNYTYKVCTGQYESGYHTFDIHSSESPIKFLVFGDIHSKDSNSIFYQYMHYYLLEGVSFIAYVGDIIDAPTDVSWQFWFSSMNDRQSTIPQLAIPGENEYVGGVQNALDVRWKHIFSNPISTSMSRFKGRSYYVDYPNLRVITIDTEALRFFSDYTITQTWLNKCLIEAGDKFTIVLMHKPVYSAGMFRDNPLIWHSFRRTLKKADIVFAGSDHSYSRRAMQDDEKLTTPVYFVVNSSDVSFIPRCSSHDQRIGVNRTFYEEVVVEKESIKVYTKLLATDEIYDDITINKSDKKVLVADSLMPEILDLPSESELNSLKARRYINRRSHRISE